MPHVTDRSSVSRQNLNAGVIIGGSSGLTSWVFDVVQAIVSSASEPIDVRILDQDEVIDATPARRQLLLSNYPSQSLIDLIDRDAPPLIYVVAEPAAAVGFMERETNLSFREALRAQTRSAVANIAIRRHGSALLFHDQSSIALGKAISILANYLALKLDLPALRSLVSHYGDGSTSLGQVVSARAVAPRNTTGLENPASAANDRLVKSILEPLLQLTWTSEPKPIVWPYTAFLWADRPNEPAPAMMELVGPARPLFYGPYFHLPPAEYEARFVASFSSAAVGMSFSLEVLGIGKAGERNLRSISFSVPSQGAFLGTFGLAHSCAEEAIEIRLRSDRGAIEGRMALDRFEFMPVDIQSQTESPATLRSLDAPYHP